MLTGSVKSWLSVLSVHHLWRQLVRVLLVSNTGICGVALWGQLQHEALLKLGISSTLHPTDFPNYLPPDAHTYDVIHLNWFPTTIGHILPEHLPEGPLLSAFYHETGSSQPHPMWSPKIRLKLAAEPAAGCELWTMPIPDHVPQNIPLRFDVGMTGLRRDGLDWIQPVCERNGWTLSTPNGWLPVEEEIDRLASCRVVVCHPHSGNPGQSMSVSFCIASRRPTLINSNRMVSQIWARDQELGKELYLSDDVERGIREVLEERPLAKRPTLLADTYSWTAQTRRLVEMWREIGR